MINDYKEYQFMNEKEKKLKNMVIELFFIRDKVIGRQWTSEAVEKNIE